MGTLSTIDQYLPKQIDRPCPPGAGCLPAKICNTCQLIQASESLHGRA